MRVKRRPTGASSSVRQPYDFVYPSGGGRCLLNRAGFAETEALAPGKHNVVSAFVPDAAGPPIGRGGVGPLSVDGRVVSQQKMAQTVPFYL